MSILNVDKIQPIGSGSTVTVNATDTILTNAQAGVITATSFTGTINTAAQGNITSLGLLTGLAIDDNTDTSMSSSSAGQLKVGGNGYTGAIALDGDAMHIYHNSSIRGLVLGTNETERLRITGAGGVGIGTAIPGAEFEVRGTSTVALFKGTGGTAFIGLLDVDAGAGYGYIGSDNGALLFQTPGSGYSTKLNIASDGKISAGTVQTTHTLGITGGSSSQLLVKGTEADIWMESTGPNAVWRILGSTGTNTHRFRIYDNTNGKEPFYIDGSSGSNTQHVHINSGNLVFDANGTGIDFSANTNDEGGAGSISSNGEIFDDYEEGSWTPVADGAGTISGTSITYSGFYTKVGRVVHLEFYANNSAGNIEISNYKIFSGLPFATGSGNYGTGRIMTEDGDVVARQGDIIVGGSSFLINKCGSSSGTVRLSGTVTYIAT